MVICVPTYTMASSMLDQGFSWQTAIWLVFLANCFVLVPMLLIGRAGTHYGTPFPVLTRASFGVRGANLPAVLRGRVACGWLSINCYFGGLAPLIRLYPKCPAPNGRIVLSTARLRIWRRYASLPLRLKSAR